MRSNEHHDYVAVIGGGVAGLAAAALIARRGQTARLFEQSHSIGGRAQTKRQDGFYLNIGPHALYRGGRGIEVLRELGVEPRGRAPRSRAPSRSRTARSTPSPRAPYHCLPAIVVEDLPTMTRAATRYTIHFEVNDEGRIRGLHAVIAPSKLSAIS